MNKETRKLSKMPEEVRAEISPHFHERSAMNDQSEVTQRISKINGSAEYVHSGLMVRIFSFLPVPELWLFIF